MKRGLIALAVATLLAALVALCFPYRYDEIDLLSIKAPPGPSPGWGRTRSGATSGPGSSWERGSLSPSVSRTPPASFLGAGLGSVAGYFAVWWMPP